MSLSTKTTKFLVSTVVALGLTGVASATDREFNGSVSNSWNHADNWTPSGIPSSSDDVTIPDATVCEVDSNDAEANSVVIEAGGLLKILDGPTNDPHTLRIFGANDMDSSVADAQGLQIVGPDSKLMISGDLAFGGTGSIQGQDPAILVEIEESADKLTLTATFEGLGQIMGAGKFVNGNGGLVNANAAGDLVVNPGTLDPDHANAEWRSSSNANARLLFQKGNTSMQGDFVITAGKIEIDAVITTAGKVDQDAGSLFVNENFTAAEYDWEGGGGRLEGGHTPYVQFQYTTFTSTSKTNPDNYNAGGDTDPPYEIRNSSISHLPW